MHHALPRPDVISSLQALARLVGPVEALRAWQHAAAVTGHHGTDLTEQQLLDIAAVLQDGDVRVHGSSLAARVRTCLVLARTPAGARR